jgi:hypothetical protein
LSRNEDRYIIIACISDIERHSEDDNEVALHREHSILSAEIGWQENHAKEVAEELNNKTVALKEH